MNKTYIFDFDGTIITPLNINYDEMKNKIKKILGFEQELKPMFDMINDLSLNNTIKKMCFDLIDEYEINALLNCKINKNILNIYEKSKVKIILSRNGEKVIKHFFNIYNLPQPDFISCRDNCSKLKPNLEQINIIFQKYPLLNKDNIIILGDSWHDKQLAININCEFYNVIN